MFSTQRLAAWILCLALPAGQAGAAAPAEMRHGGPVRGLAFSRDGKYLLSGSEDHTAQLWVVATGAAVCEPLRHDGVVKAVAYSLDGRTVATGSSDRTARLWDARTGKPIGKVCQHQGEVNAIALSSDGRYLLTGSDDATARLWNAHTGDLVATLRHPRAVIRLAFFPDSRTAVTYCKDFTFRKWDVIAAKELGTIGNKRDHTAFDIAFDGHEMLIATRDNGCHLRDIAGDRPLTPRLVYYFACIDAGFSWDSRLFFMRKLQRGQPGAAPIAQLWETATCKQIGRPLQAVYRLAFHPNGRVMAVADADSVITFRDLADQSNSGGELPPQQLWQNLEGPRASPGISAVLALAVMPDQALPLLERHLQPLAPTDPARLGKLIGDLDDDSFTVREKAEEELGRAGATAEPVVRAALAKKPTLDVDMRLSRLLGTTGTLPDSPERLGSLRGIQVLEMIGTPRAQQLLRALATGAPQLYVSCAARSALDRLAGSNLGSSPSDSAK